MVSGSDRVSAATDPRVTVFVCANCARGAVAASAVPKAVQPPRFDWPAHIEVEQVMVPCTGTIQPEHILKAIEAGADLVCVIGCEPDNCHRFEGSRRAARRVDYVGQMLDELGLGADRVIWTSLPGSARQDTAAGAGAAADACEGLDEKVAAVRDRIVQHLASLPPNPLRQQSAADGKTIEQLSGSGLSK